MTPGTSVVFTCTFNSVAQSGSANADSYTQSYKTQDSTASGLVSAGSDTVYIAASDATWGATIVYVTTPSGQNYWTLKAGSKVVVEFGLTSAGTPHKGLGGIPITFKMKNTVGTYNASGLATLTASGMTVGVVGATYGMVNATFFPDPVIADDSGVGAQVKAVAGGASANFGGNFQSASIIVTTALAPTAIAVKVASGQLNQVEDYTPSSAIDADQITVSSTDKYTNPAPAAADILVTLAAVNVVGSSAGWACSTTGNYPANVATSINVKILLGNTFVLADSPTPACASGFMNYYFGTNYGDQSFITASASGFATAHSKTITTWGFNQFNSGADVSYLKPTGLKNVLAGGSIVISFKFTVPQANVPVTFAIVKALSSHKYAGTFGNGGNTTTAITNSKGIANVTLTVDNMAGAFTQVGISYPCGYPEVTCNANGGHNIQNGYTTNVITTIAGPAVKLVFAAAYDVGFHSDATITRMAVNGSTLFLDVISEDAFNNTAVISTLSNTQVTLSPPAGLSASTLFIVSGATDTAFFGGPVSWKLSATVGASLTLTATATGLTSGTLTITTVSGTPSVLVKHPTPVNGVLYSKYSAVTFSGNANISAGYAATGPAKATIVKIGYSLNGGKWHSYSVPTPAASVSWSFAVTLPSGLSTAQFNATDSNGNVAVTPVMQVLVDSGLPVSGFTTANKATVTAGTPVTAWVYDLEGDLNASSVVVKANLTAPLVFTALPAADVSVTGSNSLGHNVTYGIAITGLTAGTWTLHLYASDLAGNAATMKSLIVHVTVAFAVSFSVSGTPTYGAVGGFNGISAKYINQGSATQNVVVFAVWKNGAGQTVAVTAGSMTVASGASGTAFAPLVTGLPSGTYTVNVFVWTTGNLSVSSTTTITVTV